MSTTHPFPNPIHTKSASARLLAAISRLTFGNQASGGSLLKKWLRFPIEFSAARRLESVSEISVLDLFPGAELPVTIALPKLDRPSWRLLAVPLFHLPTIHWVDSDVLWSPVKYCYYCCCCCCKSVECFRKWFPSCHQRRSGPCPLGDSHAGVVVVVLLLLYYSSPLRQSVAASCWLRLGQRRRMPATNQSSWCRDRDGEEGLSY